MTEFLRRWGAVVFFAVIGFFVLTACQTAPDEPVPEFDAVDFADDMIPLAADSVQVVDESGSPGAPPRIEAELKPETVPASILQRWPGERIRLTGGEARATFTIREASVRSEELTTTEGIQGWFRREPVERIHISLNAALVLNGEDGSRRGQASVQVTRRTTIMEGTSTADRQRAIHDAVTQAVDAFDNQMGDSVRSSLGSFIAQGPAA